MIKQSTTPFTHSSDKPSGKPARTSPASPVNLGSGNSHPNSSLPELRRRIELSAPGTVPLQSEAARRYYRLTPKEFLLYYLLCTNTLVTKDMIHSALWPTLRNQQSLLNYTRVLLWHLRRKTGADIRNVRGTGHYLTEVDRTERLTTLNTLLAKQIEMSDTSNVEIKQEKYK